MRAVLGINDSIVLGSGLQCPADSNAFAPTAIAGLALWLRGDLGVTLNSQSAPNTNAFQNWVLSNTSVVANATVDPFGGSTADQVVESATTSAHSLSLSTVSAYVSGSSYTVSVYAKTNGRRWILLEADSNKSCYFDIISGVVGNSSSAVGTIEDAGSGWYKCTIAFTGGGVSGTVNIYMSTANGGGGLNYAGDGTSGVYLYQLAFTGGTVSAWADQGGGDHDVAMGSAALQPAYHEADSAFANQACLIFDGGDLLSFVAPWAQALPVTVFAAVRADAGTNQYETLLNRDGTGYSFTIAGSIDDRVRGFFDGVGQAIPLPELRVHGATRVLMLRVEGTTMYASSNGGAESSVAIGGAPSAGNWLSIGESTIYSLAGKLGELIIYNAALTSGQIATVVEYLRERYGI